MKRPFPLSVLGFLAIILTVAAQPLLAQQPIPAVPIGGGDPLVQQSDRFEAIVNRVLPAVLSVEAVKQAKNEKTGKLRPVEETGSGVIVKVEGRPGYFVITNNHVIDKATTDNITLHMADGRILRPSKVWADPETDVAFMSVGVPRLFPGGIL